MLGETLHQLLMELRTRFPETGFPSWAQRGQDPVPDEHHRSKIQESFLHAKPLVYWNPRIPFNNLARVLVFETNLCKGAPIGTVMAVTNLLQTLTQLGIVPVVALDDPADSPKLARALAQGGLPLVEITFRTHAAAAAIENIAHAEPTVMVGAGTVLNVADLEAAKRSGARFAVAPGTNPRLLQRAQELALPFIPGVATPSDIETALELGCRLVKFFPAEALGGLPMLQALSAPYQHTGLRFLPTGGINPQNMQPYLKLSTVAAVGGTWLARKEDLANGRWDEVRDRCRQAVQLLAQLRSENQTRTQ